MRHSDAGLRARGLSSRQPHVTETLRRTRFGFDLLRACSVLVLLSACADSAPAPEPPGDGDWVAYGRDAGGSKYSPLDQITPGNVGDLELAWSWETGERVISGPQAPIRGQDVRPGNFETTPLAFNDTLFFTTAYNRVIALDGSTGQPHWEYDPRTVEWGQPPNGTGFVHRGVAVWSGADERRIFLNTRWRLNRARRRHGRAGAVVRPPGRDRPHRAAALAHQPPALHADVAAGGVRGPGDHRQRGVGRLRVPARSAGQRAGIRRAHGRAGVVVQPDPATGRARKRDLGGRQLGPTPGTPMPGRRWPWTRNGGSCMRESARRPTTTTAGTAWATTSTRSRWWRWTPARASSRGTSRRFTTGCGTSTCRARRCCSP